MESPPFPQFSLVNSRVDCDGRPQKMNCPTSLKDLNLKLSTLLLVVVLHFHHKQWRAPSLRPVVFVRKLYYCTAHDAMMIETPKLVEYPGVANAAVIHLQDIPRDAIQAEMGPAIQEVLRVLAERHVKPTGPLFAHHLTQSSETFDVEVGFPIDKEVIIESSTSCDGDGRRVVVKNSSLPSGTMAYTCHVGPYEELYAAWKEFAEWMMLPINNNNNNSSSMKNRKKGDTLFEIYTIGPETTTNANEYRTELYQTLQQE
jgi:effector-binding domain-containing protein